MLEKLRPLASISARMLKELRIIFTDIDDTLTLHGRLPALAYTALEKLTGIGLDIIIVTGRPAGWCDLIARQWPVRGVIGENGAFYYNYNDQTRKMHRLYTESIPNEFRDHKKRSHAFTQIFNKIVQTVPRAQIAADQNFRIFDLAIDFAEDVIPALEANNINQIVQIFKEHGATAKVSSIHVNGWFGTFNKLEMIQRVVPTLGFENFNKAQNFICYVGDSPNDEPAFEAFENSIGVNNVLQFKDQMLVLPTFLTAQEGGLGFAEFAELIVRSKKEGP